MPHRLNRSALVLLGALALAAGVLGLLVGAGVFGAVLRHRAVFDNLVGRFFSRAGGWAWPLVGLLGLLLAYVGLRWLLAQLRNDHAGELDLERDRKAGRTELASSAATSALTGELEGYRGVDSASARLIGDSRAPDLVLVVRLDERADLPTVRRRIETEGLARFRQALEMPDLHARLDLRPASSTGSVGRAA